MVYICVQHGWLVCAPACARALGRVRDHRGAVAKGGGKVLRDGRRQPRQHVTSKVDEVVPANVRERVVIVRACKNVWPWLGVGMCVEVCDYVCEFEVEQHG